LQGPRVHAPLLVRADDVIEGGTEEAMFLNRIACGLPVATRTVL
jgi:hypothetical protein